MRYPLTSGLLNDSLEDEARLTGRIVDALKHTVRLGFPWDRFALKSDPWVIFFNRAYEERHEHHRVK